MPIALTKGQIWKTNDAGYVAIVAVGKVLVHYRHSTKPIQKRSPMQAGAFVHIEALRTVESFLKRKNARLYRRAAL